MSTEAHIPKVIGPYAIEAKLGQGGMGTVFRAKHETLERPAAVKLLPHELSSNPEYVARFLREARTVATLRHDNIVQVYDAGAHEGKYYIAMELVDGQTLGQYLETVDAIGEEEGIELLYQAAKGLAAAHEQGLVHRDIKPDNMLMDKKKILRIVDFGLVAESSSNTQLTATGTALGTPMYMSPEQADGDKADARSDIYSLGVTFFRVLTGQPPFTSPTAMNLLFKHKFEAPEHPRNVRKELSENAANLILTMMAKKRENRPQSAADVVKLIEDMRAGKKIPAAPAFESQIQAGPGGTSLISPPVSGVGPAASSPGRSGRLLAAAGICAGVLLVVVVVAMLAGGGDKGQAAEKAKDSSGTPADIPAVAAKADPADETPDAPATDPKAKKRQTLMREAALLTENGNLASALVKYEEAKALKPGEDVDGKIVDLRHRLAMEEVERLRGMGDYEKALEKAREAHAIKDSTQVVESLRARVETGQALADAEKAERDGDFLAAAQAYDRAADAAVEGEDPAINGYREKAKTYRYQAHLKNANRLEMEGDYNGALAALTQALAIQNDPEVAKRRSAIAAKAANEKQFREYIDLGDAAMLRTNYIQARQSYQMALKERPESVLAQKKFNEASARASIAMAEESQKRGDLTRARELYEQARSEDGSVAGLVAQRLADLDQLAGKQPPATMPPVTAPGTQPAGITDLRKLAETVDGLVRQHRIDDALAHADAAQRAAPTDARIKAYRQTVKDLKDISDVSTSLQTIFRRGVQPIRDVKKHNSREDYVVNMESILDRYITSAQGNFDSAKTGFLQRQPEKIAEQMVDLRKQANRAANVFNRAAGEYDDVAEKAGKFKGVRGPFFKLGKEGNSEKADDFKALASTFRDMARDAQKYAE